MSERTARLDELLREEISEVLRREVDDPRIGFMTITNVDVAPDLRHASVWVSLIGSADERRLTLRALSRAMPFVRQRLGRLRLKRIPDLHIKEDQTAERGTRILRILDGLQQGTEIEAEQVGETLPTPRVAAPPEPTDGAAAPDQIVAPRTADD